MIGDPFSRAQAMHKGAPQAPASPAAPLPAVPQHSIQPMPTTQYTDVARKLGVGHWKLDANPIVARTQLMKHLEGKYGANFLAHPEVKQLMDAFNRGSAGGQDNLDTRPAKTMSALLGARA
jgi:hypothetical protein